MKKNKKYLKSAFNTFGRLERNLSRACLGSRKMTMNKAVQTSTTLSLTALSAFKTIFSHYYIVLLLLLSSCRKDVKLNLPDYEQKLVVEGSIETGGTALVFLSYSVPYFSEFDFSTPEKAFVKGALITVSDGVTTDTLRELDPNTGYLYLGFKLRGVQGKTYTIKVKVNDKTFVTSSTIQTPAALDSIYFVENNDSLGFLGQRFNEPAGTGDCYRWLAKRLGRDEFYSAPFNSVFDDKFIEGKSFDFVYNRGTQPNPSGSGVDDYERGSYKRGDTVVVKFCKIGRREYEFWNTYYQNKASNGNPFSSPANVKSMFDDPQKCFGGFVAYSPVFDTIVIPEE